MSILFTAPHNAVELAALIFCWLAASVAGLVLYQISLVVLMVVGGLLNEILRGLDEIAAGIISLFRRP